MNTDRILNIPAEEYHGDVQDSVCIHFSDLGLGWF